MIPLHDHPTPEKMDLLFWYYVSLLTVFAIIGFLCSYFDKRNKK